MHRTLILSIAVVSVALAAGCSMCGHPHDRCGPTCTGDGSLGCGMQGRAGSVIEPYGEPVGRQPGSETADTAPKAAASSDLTTPLPDQPTPVVVPQTAPQTAPQAVPTTTPQPAPRKVPSVQRQALRATPATPFVRETPASSR